MLVLMECPHCHRTFLHPDRRSVYVDMNDMSGRYRSGESVRACAAAAGVSYSTMRNRLIEAGVKMRTQRGSRRGVR